MFEEEDVKANQSSISVAESVKDEGLKFYFVKRLPYSDFKSQLESAQKRCQELKQEIAEAREQQLSFGIKAASTVGIRHFVYSCIGSKNYMLDFLELARDKLKKRAGQVVERNLAKAERRLQILNIQPPFESLINSSCFFFGYSEYKEEALLKLEALRQNLRKAKEEDENIKQIDLYEKRNSEENSDVEAKGETSDRNLSIQRIEQLIDLVNALPSDLKLQQELGKLMWEFDEAEGEHNYMKKLIDDYLLEELKYINEEKAELELLVDTTLEQEAMAILSTYKNAEVLAEMKNVAALAELSSKQVDELVDRLKNDAAFKSKYYYSLAEVRESKRQRRDGNLESVEGEQQDLSNLQLDDSEASDSEPVAHSEDMEEDD